MKRRFIILGGALCAFMVWLPKHHSTQANQAEAQQCAIALKEARSRLEAVESGLVNARQRLNDLERARTRTTADVGALEADLAKVNPESRWAAPPARWPEWISASPYVWIRKEVVESIPGEAFKNDGTLRPEIGLVLALSESEMRNLNTKLSRICDDWHKLEAGAVERSDQHLPGVGSQDGDKVTVVVRTVEDQAGRFKKEYEETLRDGLGAQRGDLVISQSRWWIGKEFNESKAEPTTITLVRQSNGWYSVGVRDGNSGLSTAVPKDKPEQLGFYIPQYLMPFFSELLPEGGATP